jgi:hypothetical protein
MNPFLEALRLPWHMVRILAFRHNGKGLPARYDFDLVTVAALSLAIGELRWSMLEPEGTPLETASQYGLCLILAALLMPATRFSLMTLAFIGTDLVAIALSYAGIDCSEGWLFDLLVVWCIMASAVADRTVRKGKAAAR